MIPGCEKGSTWSNWPKDKASMWKEGGKGKEPQGNGVGALIRLCLKAEFFQWIFPHEPTVFLYCLNSFKMGLHLKAPDLIKGLKLHS